MKILVIANHYAVCSGRYITDAFKRLGHDVRHTGKPMGREIWGLMLPPDSVWEPDGETPIALGGDFDLIIVADSDPEILNSVEFLAKNWKTPIVVWGVDNHVRAYRRRYFDHYFRAHRNVSLEDWYELPPGDYSDASDVTHLPCAYDPVLFTPSQIPYEDRVYDVCMLGYVYPQRMAVIKALQAAGVKVLWGCGLVSESYAQAYQNSRISLCLSARGDVAQRIFETAATGCVVMSDPCPDFDILKPEGVIILDDPNRIVEDVQIILSQPAVAKAAIEKSLAWVKPHTWDARAQVVVDWYQENYGERQNAYALR